MSKEFTKNHIVPKRYLDRFGFDGNKKRLIGVRVIVNDEAVYFTQSTDSVGYINNIYDLKKTDDDKYLEKILAREFDYLCGTELETIISVICLSVNDAVVLNEHSKDVLAKIIICQLLRIPESINYIYKLFPEIERNVKKNIVSSLPKSIAKKYRLIIKNATLSIEELKNLYFSFLFSDEEIEKLTGILKRGVWVAYYNADYEVLPFITSDNPVLVEGFEKKEIGLFNNGLTSPETCIFFPLTPSVAIAIYAENGFWKISKERLDGKKIVLHEKRFVYSKNLKIMGQAYKHAFIPKKLFDDIDDYLKTVKEK